MSVSPKDRRILSDLRELEKSNLDGIYFHVGDDDIKKVFVVITGTEGTPYDNCPLLFEFEFPELYPMVPPNVKFCTGDGSTRFNPNLYVDGKVCLSILGTWKGPSWTPVMTLLTIINSILALVMNEEPLRNEPGWENATKHDITEYNQVVEYRSLCVGLVQQLNQLHPNFEPLREKMVERFKKDYPKIMERVGKNKKELDGKFVNPRYGESWTLNYTQLKKDLEKLGKQLSIDVKVRDNSTDKVEVESTSAGISTDGVRPKPRDTELGTVWEGNGKRYECAENARGIKFWKILR